MNYISNLLSLFGFLFSQGAKFIPIIALVTTSGVVGGLVLLFKRFINMRSFNE